MSDNGNALFPNGNSVLEAVGFCKHVPYPAVVHQYLSPNDNRLHGTAKEAWRASEIDFSDDVSASLFLLNLLDVNIKNHSKTWFTRNILNLTRESAKDLIVGKGGKTGERNEQRRCAYLAFAALNSQVDDIIVPMHEGRIKKSARSTG